MPTLPHLILAAGAAEPLQAGRPLFGHMGLALLAVMAGVAALLVFTALLGRWLAATHPAPLPRPVVVVQVPTPAHARPPELGADVPAEAVPVVLAAVAQLYGARARVAAIRQASVARVVTPSIEALMQEWSHEGRRQIYSSHKVR